jgi:hypothetical protein
MITFTRRSQAFADETGLSTETVTTITGHAVQVRGAAATYARLGLSETQAPTLLITPTTYGLRAWSDEFVRPGDEVEWAGGSFVVQDVAPIAPDGVVIAARVVIARGAP